MRLIYLAVVFVILASSVVLAERAPRSPEELKKESSHIVVGTVHGVYSRDADSKMYGKGTVITNYVIEVQVEGTEKGEKLTKGDLIYVRCWKLKKHGENGVTPGPSGHFDIPKEGDKVTVYVDEGKRDPKSQTNQGFNVLEPNGFTTTPAKK